ncbi:MULTISPECIES: hypothetical protein [unclassified Enterococcus]|uniref:hypothetical protein n=1 Tax=unclassified Enterococcus TaxID=2608891 RepID=UPI0013E9B472|nr:MULTISPECIES: hypothetical protein [unclassified Enterococcus]
MKKLIILMALVTGIFTLTGCNTGQSTDKTTETTTYQADKADITDSIYTLKVREDLNLVSGTIKFTDNKMEWTREYDIKSSDSSEEMDKKTTLTDIKITTDKNVYTISGKQNDKNVKISFTKIGNYRIKDEDGNIYSL